MGRAGAWAERVLTRAGKRRPPPGGGSPASDRPKDLADTRQVRLATTVIVAAMVVWMGASALGGALGLPVRLALLLDLACMAAMVWALVVIYRVWRRRRPADE